ncbi:MAG: efflux RND transporter periplasmic adaptor subunit [Phycisphaerales bacterium]|nr:efflux RND transporter periplasmic adaptor subunit [Phycisphaerales bacterium]
MIREIPADTMKELRGVLARWAVLIALLGVFALWATWRLAHATHGAHAMADTPAQSPAQSEPQIEYWTCTMHPQVHEPNPGKCPICGMPLVEKYVGSDSPGVKPEPMPATSHAAHAKPDESQAWYRCTMPECGDQGSSDPNSRCPVCGMKRERVDTGGGNAEATEVQLSPRAVRLAEVATEPVTSRLLYKRIRAVGRVGYDETRYKMVSAWIGGRIDKLYADFTGMTVNKGDHLVEIYSPELLSAQEEYLQAVSAAKAAQSSQTGVALRSAEQVLSSARRKLELLGVTTDQITDIESSEKPQTHLVVYAPIGGTIVKKQAMEGMYVSTGSALYTIADLTHLWLLVDLYESDLPWVKPFQKVSVTTRALPGDVFTGEIVFVDPRVDPQTRTVQVRIHVDNAAMRIKPDMWVAAEIDAGLSRDGGGAVPAPGGEYACPMHPWETSNEPGTCPICAMDLVKIEDLPQYVPPTDISAILAVPRGAVMQTGERALVYIETAPATYRGVEVTIGPLAQDDAGNEFYPVLSGLTGGERVVTRGNFAIDSQMQLAGKPSLFAARGLGGASHNMHGNHSDHGDHTEHDDHEMSMKQTTCPVMGNEIDPEVYTDYHGERIYFCCPPCIEKFLADPRKYVANLPTGIQAKLAQAETREANHD